LHDEGIRGVGFNWNESFKAPLLLFFFFFYPCCRCSPHRAFPAVYAVRRVVSGDNEDMLPELARYAQSCLTVTNMTPLETASMHVLAYRVISVLLSFALPAELANTVRLETTEHGMLKAMHHRRHLIFTFFLPSFLPFLLFLLFFQLLSMLSNIASSLSDWQASEHGVHVRCAALCLLGSTPNYCSLSSVVCPFSFSCPV
jgi:hypothetical protein